MNKDLGVKGLFVISSVLTGFAMFLLLTDWQVTIVPILVLIISFIFGIATLVRSIKEKKLLFGVTAVAFSLIVFACSVYILKLAEEQRLEKNQIILDEMTKLYGSIPLDN